MLNFNHFIFSNFLKVCEDDIDCHSFEEVATEPAVKADQTESTVRLVIAEIIKFKEEFELIRNDPSIETDLSSFWLRKTKKPVLAVLLVQKPGQRPKLYRGTNMEVSMPTGSLCAERNVIGSALADDLTLRRQDLKVIAVYSVGSLDISETKTRRERFGSYGSEDTLSNMGSEHNYGHRIPMSASGGVTAETSPSTSRTMTPKSSSKQDIQLLSKDNYSEVRSSSRGLSEGVVMRNKRHKESADVADIISKNTDTYRSSVHGHQHSNGSSSSSSGSGSGNMDQDDNGYIGNSSLFCSVKSISSPNSSNSVPVPIPLTAADEVHSESILDELSSLKLPPSASLAQIDARRQVTAGRRSYSVDSVWVMRPPGVRNSEDSFPHSGIGGESNGSTILAELGASSSSNSRLLNTDIGREWEGTDKSISMSMSMTRSVPRSPIGKKRDIMNIPISWPHKNGDSSSVAFGVTSKLKELEVSSIVLNTESLSKSGKWKG